MSTTPAPDAATFQSQWKRVLLTTDFSEDSLAAWRKAASLTSLQDSEITVLHVAEPAFQGMRIQTDSLHGDMQHSATGRLREFASQVFSDRFKVRYHCEQGRPATVICEFAKKIGADLIAISSHGHSGLKHVILGSVVESVVRHAPCAVLVIPAADGR